MPLPIDDLTVVHLDAATDDPSQARAELLATVNKVKAIIAVLDDGPLSGINADMIDGFHASTAAAANIIPAHDASGRLHLGSIVGIGTAPDTDHDMSLVQAGAEFGEWGFIFSRAGSDTYYTRNAKLVAGAWVYKNTSTATVMVLDADGGTRFLSTPSGTAGTGISWAVRLAIPTTYGAALTYEGKEIPAGGDYVGHPVAGYVKVGTGIYNKTSAATDTGLVFNTLTAIAAPAGAKGLILRIYNIATANNALGTQCKSTVSIYSDSAGTSIKTYTSVFAYEFAATSLGVAIATDRAEILAPVISGNAYIKQTEQSSASSSAFYAIVGYTV